MGRKTFAGVLVIIGLTVINMWMAKYVIKPLKSGQPGKLPSGPSHSKRKISDLLVMSVKDIHPIQHLEAAAKQDEKAKQGSQSLSPARPANQLAAPNLGGKPEKTKPESHVQSAHPDTMPDSPNTDYDSPFIMPMIKGSGGHQAGSTGLGGGGALTFENAGLGSVDTVNLENLKQSLVALKKTLASRDYAKPQPLFSALQNSLGSQGDAATNQNVGLPPNSAFGSDSKANNKGGNTLYGDEKPADFPQGDFILNSFQNIAQPPPLAAPLMTEGVDKDLLHKLLSVTDAQVLKRLITGNTKAIHTLLSQILEHQKRVATGQSNVQVPQFQPLQQQQQQQHEQQQNGSPLHQMGDNSHLSMQLPYPVNAQNKHLFDMMVDNIAQNNFVEKNTEEGNELENLLRDLRSGKMRMEGLLPVQNIEANGVGFKDQQGESDSGRFQTGKDL